MIHPLLGVLLALNAAQAQPPTDVLQRLDEALDRLNDPAQVDSFMVTTIATYSDLDGDDAHTEVVVTRLSWDAAGAPQLEKISHLRDGQPFSEEEAAARREKSSDDDQAQAELSLAAPAGEDLARYVYGATRQEGGAMVASFEPAPGERSAKDLAAGLLAWDADAGRPLWIQLSPVKKPFMVKSLDNRLLLGESEGRLHTVRITSWGEGGPPLMRKKFRMEMRFSEVDWR